jgi:phosphatidylinositol alpha-1,6-mannosyltransferase
VEHIESSSFPKTLIVTNDFPPRVGGVQQYLFNLVSNFPAGRVTVVAPEWAGADEHDSSLAFRVQRLPSAWTWPSRSLIALIDRTIADDGAEVVLFGSAIPPALLGPRLSHRGIPYVVATHGVEYWMALVPGVAGSLRYATSTASRVLAISEFTARTIRTVVPRRVPMSLAPPGVDTGRFTPHVDATFVRERHDLAGRPVVLCVSRLVRRKGQDVLISSMGKIRARVPGATLLIVGDGPDAVRLRSMAASADPGSVIFAGAVSDEELPAYHSAADVFCMPCRSRLAGLEVEGFGIVFLEAAASGKPVVAGASGGAAEAVLDGETGFVIDGRAESAIVETVSSLLGDAELRDRMGKAGRRRAEDSYAWPILAERVSRVLRLAAGGASSVGM